MVTDKNTKSSQTFHTFLLCFTSNHPEEIMVIFSFSVDTIPKLEKEDQQIVYF